MKMPRRGKYSSLTAALAMAVLASCAREPAVVQELRISIDAANNCLMDGKPVECAGVAAAIKTRYPTSTPRVDICLDRQARFEAATEVMKSVEAAGFPVGTMDCSTTVSPG